MLNLEQYTEEVGIFLESDPIVDETIWVDLPVEEISDPIVEEQIWVDLPVEEISEPIANELTSQPEDFILFDASEPNINTTNNDNTDSAIDTAKKYSVTIYVDNRGVPHTWIDLNNDGITNSYGYAPAKHRDIKGFFGTTPGKIYNDTQDLHEWDQKLTLSISEEQYDAIKNVGEDWTNNPGLYSIWSPSAGTRNCVTFVYESLQAAGLSEVIGDKSPALPWTIDLEQASTKFPGSNYEIDPNSPRLNRNGELGASIDPTIINNGDGSQILAFADNNDESWSEYEVTVDSEGTVDEVEVEFDDGTSSDLIFDSDNTETWDSYWIDYNSSGEAIAQTITQDDGTSYTNTFEPTDDPDSPPQLPGQSLNTTLDFLNLIKAIQNGQPLSIAVSGLKLGSDIFPDNSLLADVSAAGGAVMNLINLENLLRNTDKVTALTTGVQIVSSATNLYKNYLISQYGGDAIAAIADNPDFFQFANDLNTAIPYLNIFYSLYQEDYVNAAIGVLYLIPGGQTIAIVATIINVLIELFDDPPEPWGDSIFIWQGDQIGLSVTGDYGGNEAVQSVASQVLSTLNQIVSETLNSSPDAKLGLIPNRIPILSLRDGAFILYDIDLSNGQVKERRYNSYGIPIGASPGSPDYFSNLGQDYILAALKRSAIAPQWEVDTARLQTEAGILYAGLTEEERAARTGQLAPLLAPDATTQSFKPIILDLNGDGVKIVDLDQSTVAFDVDDSGFLKKTGWAEQNDGFLVLDRNYDGYADSGKELFSNIEVAVAARGLQSLNWVDANNDGKITTADPVYAELRVWQDANSNGVTDDGETMTLEQLGIALLNYSQGNYEVNGTTREVASPDLVADTQGSQYQIVENGILITSTDGRASLLITQVEDLSSSSPGSDRVTTNENLAVDILVSDLLRNDAMDNPSDNLSVSGVANPRHGTVGLQNGVVHFVPETYYNGYDAGFDYYTNTDRTISVSMNITPENQTPEIDSVVYEQAQVLVSVPLNPGSDYPNYTDEFQDDPYNGEGQLFVRDVDDPQESLTFSIKHQARYGTATIDQFKGQFSFNTSGTPDLPNGGQDAFAIEVSDPHGASTTYTLIVDIPAWNPPQTGGDGGGDGSEGTGSEGTGSEGTGSEGTGSEGTGSEGTGGEGTGGEGTGGEGTGGEGTGGEGTGGEGTGGEGTGGDGGSGDGGGGDGGGGDGGGGDGGGGDGGGGDGGGGGGDGGGGGEPIVLDLNGNGFNLLNADTSPAFFDILGDGTRYQMGWIGSGDGLLAYDYDGDNLINHRSEIAFIDYKPGAKTDLEGLTAFDSNLDGVFNNLDAEWNKFGVWEDRNSDGITDRGELQNVMSLGISSINLTSDGRSSLVNGNIIHGVTQVMIDDGRLLNAADVTFNVTEQVLL
jgi:VCBS repeat-containing protein